ncbi:MAG: hypothetical protein M3Y66_08160, partial [Actinomycetota bacterium]|nr:hypothetical protein [Actinomycetota bacterium]
MRDLGEVDLGPSRRGVLLGAVGVLGLAACGQPASGSGDGATTTKASTLSISAIPDQDPAKLTRLYSLVATRFTKDTGLQ